MKRRFWIILSILLIAAVAALTALHDGETANENMSQTTGTVATAVWFSDVYYWNPPVWSQAEGTITGAITKKTGLAPILSIPEDNGDSRLSLMLINGNLPDIISIADKTMISHLVKSDKLWPMEEFLKTYMSDSHLLKDFPEDVKSVLTERDGDWYAIPSNMQSQDNNELYPMSDDYWKRDALYADGLTVIWNKALLKRLGLTKEELQTEAQVLGAFEKAQERGLLVNGNEVIPLVIDGIDYQNQTLTALQNFFGAEEIDEDGNYRDRLLAPESKHAMKFLNTAFREGYLNSDGFMIDNKQIQEYIASGRVLCYIGNVLKTGMNESDWLSTAPILSSEDTRPVLGINQQTSSGWISTFITKECTNPEAVAKWLDYMTSSEGMLLSNYGYENQDYTLNEEGLVVMTQQGLIKKKAYYETGLGAWWPFFNKNWYFSVTSVPSEGDKTSARYQILCALGQNELTSVYDSALVDFPVDYIDSNSLLGDIETQIRKYKKSQITTVILSPTEGAFEEQYNEMINSLEEMGIKTVDEKKSLKYRQNTVRYMKVIEKVN